jgi:hypothetical protein
MVPVDGKLIFGVGVNCREPPSASSSIHTINSVELDLEIFEGSALPPRLKETPAFVLEVFRRKELLNEEGGGGEALLSIWDWGMPSSIQGGNGDDNGRLSKSSLEYPVGMLLIGYPVETNSAK